MDLRETQFRNVDTVLFILIIILSLIGISFIFSANYYEENLSMKHIYLKQIFWMFLGLIAMFIAFKTPTLLYKQIHWLLYFICIILLFGLFFFSADVTNTERWYDLGFFRFQPSELAKLVLILVLASVLSKPDYKYDEWYKLLKPIFLFSILFILVVKQPDLGTAMIFVPILFSLLFWIDTKIIFIVGLILPAFSLILSFSLLYWSIFFIISSFILFYLRKIENKSVSIWLVIFLILINIGMGIAGPKVWNALKPYQQKRILNFLHPEMDVKESGYQVLQARYAIGSGGLKGKGFLQGTQKRLEYVPEHHTDFIFSIYGEEVGFIGCLILFLLYLSVIYRGLKIALNVEDEFDSLVAIGIITWFFSQIFVNTGMNMGILPVAGVPLPFMSYGGTSLLVFYYAFGILLNISKKQLKF